MHLHKWYAQQREILRGRKPMRDPRTTWHRGFSSGVGVGYFAGLVTGLIVVCVIRWLVH